MLFEDKGGLLLEFKETDSLWAQQALVSGVPCLPGIYATPGRVWGDEIWRSPHAR